LVGTLGWVEAVKEHKSPGRRLVITMMPEALEPRPRTELENAFIAYLRCHSLPPLLVEIA
jgi:hypothetical protein